MYEYQQPYPPQQQQQQQQQLVPHYGTSYDPFQANQNQQYSQQQQQQQQAPPAYNPSYYYSPPSAAPTAPTNDAVPTQVNARSNFASDPSLVTMPSMDNIGAAAAAAEVDSNNSNNNAVDNDDDDDDLKEIIKSQQLAWQNAQKRNVTQQESAMTTYNPESNIPVPRSRNPNGSDSVHPNKRQMKEGRKVTTAAAATSGALVGAIVTGPAFPVGALIGGVVGGYSANKIHKQGERRAQRKWEQSNFQLGTNKAPIFSNKGTATIHTIV